MRFIVISSQQDFATEMQAINALFDEGLEWFHVRKPHKTKDETKSFLEKISPPHHSKVVLHAHADLAHEYGLRGVHINKNQQLNPDDFAGLSLSASLHSVEALNASDRRWGYVFLSPIFDSLSKENYKSPFEDKALLKRQLAEYHQKASMPKVIALGGIHSGNVLQVKALGFDGVACIGAIWKAPERTSLKEFVARFHQIKALCR